MEKKNSKINDLGKLIVQDGHPALREVAKKIPIEEIKSEKIQSLIKKMKDALASQDDGVGIAGSQLGEPLAIFIVSKKAFKDLKDAPNEDLVIINPELLKVSKKKEWMDEGCLSVRPLFGRVKRSVKATLRGYDENAKHFELSASGFIAQIFQHEMDHLNGVLFIDKAVDVIEMPLNSDIGSSEDEVGVQNIAKK